MKAAQALRYISPLLFAFFILVTIELAVRAAVHLFDLELDIVVVHPHLGQAELKKQIYVNDRYLLWRMKPGMDGEFVSPALKPAGRERPRFRVVTNSRGYHGAEFSAGKAPGIYRVVCMGNSSTFGWGVPPDSCYAAILGDLLRERSGGRVEVIDAGVPGYSSAQGLVQLGREILPLDPDLVTLSFGANDCQAAQRTDRDLIVERLGTVGAVQAALNRFALYRGLRYLVVSRKVRRGFEEDSGKRVRRVPPPEFRENMASAVRSVLHSGARVVLVEILPDEPAWDPYRRIIASTGEELSVPVLSTGELFSSFLSDPEPHDAVEAGYIRGTEERYGGRVLEKHPDIYLRLDRVHPSELGHLLIARALADTLAGVPSPRE